MKYEDWEKREDDLDALYPNRKRRDWPFDYVRAAGVLIILMTGMTACVIKYYGYYPRIFF